MRTDLLIKLPRFIAKSDLKTTSTCDSWFCCEKLVFFIVVNQKMPADLFLGILISTRKVSVELAQGVAERFRALRRSSC